MVEIGNEAGGCSQHGAREAAEAVERRDAVDLAQAGLALVAGEVAARSLDRLFRCLLRFFRHDQFAGADARQHCAQQAGLAFFQLHPPGGDVAGGDATGAAHLADCGQHIGPARLQQRLFGERSGGDEAHDVALYQRL